MISEQECYRQIPQGVVASLSRARGEALNIMLQRGFLGDDWANVIAERRWTLDNDASPTSELQWRALALTFYAMIGEITCELKHALEDDDSAEDGIV
jgi:hypothetical protein